MPTAISTRRLPSLVNTQSAVHYVLRVPYSVRVDRHVMNVIDAHNEVVKVRKRVSFAKIGTPLSTHNFVLLKTQITSGKKRS
jgi:hypothetical protein